ncbi:MAG TPA: RHS repeat-associated core domain-containing protein [Anaerovoracaceae bacterium]|nr:RHS repeat-associated core domain-containing protein [Anaerovoracaceae bacterium]
MIYITDGNNNILNEFSYDTQGNPATMIYIGATYYYHVDGHGNVTALTDASGNTAAQYTYDAWGNILTQSGTVASANPLRYSGYMYDGATGLYYLMARYYDPSVGRFISRDIVQDVNLYAYCKNNPVNESDPNGLLSLGKHWYNNISDLTIIINALVIAVPALWTLRGFLVAKKAAEIAGELAFKQFENRSRKVLLQMVVELSKKVAVNNKTLAKTIQALSGAIINGIFSVAGTSVGDIVTRILNRLDGKPNDNFLWA